MLPILTQCSLVQQSLWRLDERLGSHARCYGKHFRNKYWYRFRNIKKLRINKKLWRVFFCKLPL
jgi:hypothetical protein